MSTITGVVGPNGVSSVQAAKPTGIVSGPDPPSASTTPAATRGISKTGDLMRKLQRLLDTDPKSFEGMMNQLAQDLKAAAARTNGADASFLSKLSDGFAQAGADKSLSPLRPVPKATSPPSASFGSYAQGGHRAGAGILKTFVAQAVANVEMILTPPEPPPMPPAPVQ